MSEEIQLRALRGNRQAAARETILEGIRISLQPFFFDTAFLCLHIFFNIDVDNCTVLCKNIVLNIIGVVSLALQV